MALSSLLRLAAGLAVLATGLGGVAQADPVALRLPRPEGMGGAVALGAPDSSVAWWSGGDVGVAVDLTHPLSAVGLHLGLQETLLGEADSGLGLDVYGAFGLTRPLLAGGLLPSLTPAIRGRRRGERMEWGLGLAVPLLVRPTGIATVRARPLLEGAVGVRLGEQVWLQGLGGLGATLWTGGIASLSSQGTLGLVIAW